MPNGPKTIEKYVSSNATPYPILSDKDAKFAEQYGIETRRASVLTAFTPSVFLVDQTGKIYYMNYLTLDVQEPDNNELLSVLAQSKN